MSKLCMIEPMGPLFVNPNINVRGDVLKANDCMERLDSKPPASVMYISFGSVAYIVQEQVGELAYGLLNSGISFLWVIKSADKDSTFKMHFFPDGFLVKAGNRGKVIQWSPQEEVLAHPSAACSITHCGWNSFAEAPGSARCIWRSMVKF
jgi:UDP:flavonoid glycosyltransferase YjiC (YdhE family)